MSIAFSAINRPAGVLVVDHTGRVGGLKANEAAVVRAGFTYLTDNFHAIERGHIARGRQGSARDA